MSSYVLTLDQGTTSSRALAIDAQGRTAAVAQREFPQHFPSPGWVEHDPIEIWESQLVVARETVAAIGGPEQIAAIGITNQRETTVVWERATGRPVCPAIVWQDRRTADFCAALERDGHSERVRASTGLVIDPYFSGTKLRWILDEVDGARAAAEAGELAFGTVDSWLIWNLTGGHSHLTDPTNASRTMLFNIHTGDWDPWLLSLLNIPRDLLPEVRPSAGDFGSAHAEHLGAPIPIAGVAGDQHAALFGQLCTEPGMVKTTYGTGGFLLMCTGGSPVASESGLLTTLAWDLGDGPVYALEGAVFIAGAAVQWLRDGLGLIVDAADVEALAASVADSGGLYLVPAFTGLGAPHWDPYARGTLVGISRGSSAGHLARATLEGIAFQVADVIDAMRSDAGLAIPEMRVDGGAAANDLLLQLQADLAGVEIVRPAQLETTALGAAFLAGLAVGVWPDQEALAATWTAAGRFPPVLTADDAADRRTGWGRAVARSRGWADPADGYTAAP